MQSSRKLRSRSVVPITTALALILVALLVTACGGGDETTAAPASDTNTTTGSESNAATSSGNAGCDVDGDKLAYVLHIRIPFTQQIAEGGETAATECNADYAVVGPASAANPPEAIQAFQTVVQTGAKGVAVIPYPTTELWQRPIEEATEQGVHVALGVVSGELGIPVVIENDVEVGRQMAEMAIKEIGTDATGTVVVASCAPGVSVLEDRVAGIKEGFAKEAPGVKVIGALESGQPAPQNFGNWSAIVQKNPDALAFLGTCSFDVPNLAKIKRQVNGDFLIVGNELEPESLAAIENGTVLGVVGSGIWLQGYIPIRLLAESLANDLELTAGWIDPGSEVVTKANAAEWQDRLKSPEALAAYYQPQIDEVFADVSGSMKPLADQSK